MADVWFPLQITTFAGWFTCADGLTVMVKVLVDPWQDTDPFENVGVTMMVATTGVNPAFTVVKALMLPVPVAARPIPGVSLTHD